MHEHSPRLPLRHYVAVLLVLLSFFALLEGALIDTLPIGQDEFHNNTLNAQYTEKVPYRDFKPNKTVLGYYFYTPLHLIGADDLWSTVMRVKYGILVVNVGVLFLGMLLLRRLYHPLALVGGLFLLLTVSTFIDRSTEIRLDMLAAWCGWIGMISMLRGDRIMPGVLAGVSFLVHQKGVYFCVAGVFALFADGVLARWHQQLTTTGTAQRVWLALVRGVRQAFIHGLWILVPIGLYFGFWILLAGYDGIFSNAVARNIDVAIRVFYTNLHAFWWQTIERNPIFWGASLLGLIWLCWTVLRRLRFSANHGIQNGLSDFAQPAAMRTVTLAAWTGALWGLCLWHKQPWPYFFVLLFPTLAVVIMAALDALIVGDPLSKARAVTERRFQVAILGLAVAFLVVLTMVTNRYGAVMYLDNALQRRSVALAEEILKPGDHYLMGLLLFKDRPHTYRQRLSWLDLPARGVLRQVDQNMVIKRIKREMPKLVVVNYRTQALPKPVKAFLKKHTTYYCNHLDIYAPTLDVGQKAAPLAYAGRYRVMTSSTGASVNGVAVAPGHTLDVGKEPVSHTGMVRLRLVPERDITADGREQPPQECYRTPMFANIYGY
ncbi:MAG: hypothetical protein HQL50_09110 [Magnetococcales bacterium]|nr:hypothetical protein [Magnetococcales bacterium]